MTEKRKINVDLLTVLYRLYVDEYENTGFTAIQEWGIHINLDAIEEVAPLDKWNIKNRGDGIYPYELYIHVNGAKFFALMTGEDAVELGFF